MAAALQGFPHPKIRCRYMIAGMLCRHSFANKAIPALG